MGNELIQSQIPVFEKRAQSGEVLAPFIRRLFGRSTTEPESQSDVSLVTDSQSRNPEAQGTTLMVGDPSTARRHSGFIAGAEFIPSATTPQYDFSLSDKVGPIREDQVEYTVNHKRTARRAIGGLFRDYPEKYMGGSQHWVHVLRDMRKHPERADRAISEAATIFFANAGWAILRDFVGEIPFVDQIWSISEFINGREYWDIGDDGKMHMYFRKPTTVQRIVSILQALEIPANLVYDTTRLVWSIVKDVFLFTGSILYTPIALIRGPAHGYSVKTGKIKEKPLDIV